MILVLRVSIRADLSRMWIGVRRRLGPLIHKLITDLVKLSIRGIFLVLLQTYFGTIPFTLGSHLILRFLLV